MIKDGKTYTAEGKRVLYIPKLDLTTKVYSTGTVMLPVNGKLKSITVNPGDIQEVFQVQLDGEDFKVKGDTYAELVTNLIRLKYTLDDELALAANLRAGDNNAKTAEFEFQTWRAFCKEMAKQLI